MTDCKNNFLKIKNISKRFGVVRALNNVSFCVKKGEIHTLLGENGAGKSTLVKIIKGELTPDSGQIIVDGKPFKEYSPNYSMEQGISMVHQELAIFENMTVAENIFPQCNYKTRFGFMDKKKLNKQAEDSIKIFGMDLLPDQKLDTLTLAQQQMVEILRCISLNQKIILLDEPTSGLNNEETEKLMSVLKKLKNEGISIIYISHRINEVLEISDRVTVLRDGEFVDTLVNDDKLTENVLVSSMVGRELSDSLYARKVYRDIEDEEVLMRVDGFTKKNAIYDINFELRRGEILGFFGLEGSGTNTISRMLYGLEGKEKGKMTFKGEEIANINPTTMVKKKVLYLNNNRKNAGLLLDSPALDNMAMPVLKEISNFTFVNNPKLKEYTKEFIKMFSIVIPDVQTKPRNLSGGNQQKLMISICLGTKPDCIIINEPTRGIDVGAKAEIHEFILNIAKQGLGVIVFSSELPELLGLADRIIVMKNKRIAGEISKTEINEKAIMKVAAGSGA